MKKYIFKSVLVYFAFLSHFLYSFTLADQIKTHFVETEYQNGTQEIRVLLPDDYQVDNQYPVLYVLPVSGWNTNKINQSQFFPLNSPSFSICSMRYLYMFTLSSSIVVTFLLSLSARPASPPRTAIALSVIL